MSEEPEKKSSRTGLIIVLLLVPILYVLSIGPVFMICMKTGGGSLDRISTFYHPLFWICTHIPKAQVPLLAYLELWGYGA